MLRLACSNSSLFCLASALCISATQGQAAELSRALTATGTMTLEHYQTEADEIRFGVGEIDLAYQNGASRGAGVTGFSLGIDVLSEDIPTGKTTRTALYPALEMQFGRSATASLGQPRSVADAGYQPDRDNLQLVLPNEAFSSQGGGFTKSRALENGAEGYGARLDAIPLHFGNAEFSYGASIHRFAGAASPILSVAGAVSLPEPFGALDQVLIHGSAESAGDDERLRIGAEGSMGPTTLGLDAVQTETDTGRSVTNLYMTYTLNPRVTLGVEGQIEETDGSDAIREFGVSAEYTHPSGSFVQGDVATIPDQETRYGLSVGFRF